MNNAVEPAPKVSLIQATDVELRKRFGKYGTYRGDREVWIAGEYWGFWSMTGHGSHGPSFELYDSSHSQVGKENARGRFEQVQIWAKTRRRRGDEDNRTTADKMRELAVEAILTGLFKSPARIKIELEADRRRRARAEARAEAKNSRERVFLLWAANYGPPEHRQAARECYRDVFCVDMPDLPANATEAVDP